MAIIEKSFINLADWNWHYNSGGYAVRKWFDSKGIQKSMFLHHCIIGFPINGLEVDHINRNKLDNRKSNLRFVSHRGNMRNRSVSHQNNLFGTTRTRNSWQSQIYINGKYVYLGKFKTQEEAHEKYENEIQKRGLNHATKLED
jgi:hypothetical protein